MSKVTRSAPLGLARGLGEFATTVPTETAIRATRAARTPQRTRLRFPRTDCTRAAGVENGLDGIPEGATGVPETWRKWVTYLAPDRPDKSCSFSESKSIYTLGRI